ncbi:MAG: hypothetical protein N838_15885 [Thiohalocapsa sp. PB-PSB1]|nr:MAG: hypothetical protein N838_15885 [Thiohalocapsa sp. PB-PSB1]
MSISFRLTRAIDLPCGIFCCAFSGKKEWVQPAQRYLIGIGIGIGIRIEIEKT